MFSKKFIKGLTLIAFTTVFSMSTMQSAFARPGPLATAPLFLSTIVEPNVFFTHDDSGSMFWEQMVQTGTGGFTSSSGLPLIGSYYRYYLHPDWHNDQRILPPVALFPNSWIFRNHNGNKNYYNPNVTYLPWAGTDASGNPLYKEFEASDATAAPRFPNDPGGTTTNLTTWKDFYDYDFCNCWVPGSLWLPTYYEWDDTDGDGVIEPTDGNTRVEIQPGTAEMKNFINWFVYYRKREYAAKAAIGRVINNTDASRMGLDLFNAGFQERLETMSDPVEKRTLLNTFYKLNSSGGTPARRAVERVGEMFLNNTNNAIFDQANGGECQQHFNILLSDGFWNGSNPNSKIGNADASPGSNNTIFDGDASQSNDGGNYADNHSRTLADVAMYYYETDLSPLADNVPIQPGIDENPQQHLVTYTIAFGLTGTLDSTVDDPLSVGFTWPNPYNGDPEKVDDMWHAAYNGRGKYLAAQNPEELEASLNAAIADIAQRTATAAAVSVNSTELSTDTVVYLAEFNTNRWQGDLKAFKIKLDPNGDPVASGELEASPTWSAGDKLNARWNGSSVSPERVMLTYNGDNGVAFRWANLTQAQKDDLKTSPTGTVQPDSTGQARLEYLRGDRSNEGSGLQLRERLSLLGDLVNSGPVFVGKPALGWPDKAPFPTDVGKRYSDFREDQENRDGVIYAAANDGFLHGFAEADGEEVVAYLPANLFSTGAAEGLHYLTDPDYGHQYYNDLTPTVSDIYADIGSGTRWQTILINGERGGGRGIYALNVNNPADFAEGNADKLVLWEFSSADDADLGHTYSQPQIAMANNNRWYAVFGNGYNDSGSGEAKLFILDIVGGTDGSWDVGDVIEISTGVGTAADRNGLSTPTLYDTDGDGTLDRAYAGDLYGNLWVFDLSSDNPNTWGIVNNEPLFQTIGGEPITTPPSLARHPTVSTDSGNEPNVMVYFGTGQYLTPSDKTDPSLNHFYGVWDRGSSYPLNSGQLVEQFHETGFTDDAGNPVRVTTNNPVNYLGGEFGWFFELDEAREKTIFRSVVRGGIVFFTTFIPNPDPCSAGGSSYLFAVDMITGGSADEPQVDVNNDGEVNEKDRVTRGTETAAMSGIKEEGIMPNQVFVDDIAYTGAKATKVKKLPPPPTGRFSWQELIQ